MKYLTIEDYSELTIAYGDCLKKLRDFQRNFTSDEAVKDKRRALCLLTKLAVDSGYSAFEMFKMEDILGVYQMARFILEVQSLVEWFIILPENHEDIISWFKGQMIETRYKKNTAQKIEAIIEYKKQIPFMLISKDDLLKREKYTQERFTMLSNYTHPTVFAAGKNFLDCKFGYWILEPIMNCCVDAQRVYFDPNDSVNGLMFSEFRLLFRSHEDSTAKSSP